MASWGGDTASDHSDKTVTTDQILLPSFQDPLAPYFLGISSSSQRCCAPQYPSGTFPESRFLLLATRTLMDSEGSSPKSVKGRKNMSMWRVECSVLHPHRGWKAVLSYPLPLPAFSAALIPSWRVDSRELTLVLLFPPKEHEALLCPLLARGHDATSIGRES